MSEEIQSDQQTNDGGQPPEVTQQTIFDEAFKRLTSDLAALCTAHNIKTAAIIVADPKIPEKPPLVFTVGDYYRVGRVVTYVLRTIKKRIFDDLEA